MIPVVETQNLRLRGAEMRDFDAYATFRMDPVRTVGVVVDQNGRPVPRASVSASSADGSTSYGARTDEDGAFEFDAMEPGTYELLVSPSRDGNQQKAGTFTAGKTDLRFEVRVR